jgi:hypothetical protein
MKSNRIIAVVGAIAVNLLIVGFLTFWTVIARDPSALPAVAAVHHITAMFALI